VPTPVLAFDGVIKAYGGLRPLRLRQLRVEAGEHIGLAGFDQTTAELFVNLVTGATLPDAGTVHAFGHATSAIADGDEWLQTLDRFGIVTERAVLLDQLTVVQNLAMPFTLDIEPPPDDVRARAEAIAEEVGLPAASWPARVADLDAPGRARVRLGRALAAGPALLILEHASAGLARAAAVSLGTDVRRIAATRRIALVAATADEPFAHAVAGRVFRLEPASGRLTERRRGWFT